MTELSRDFRKSAHFREFAYRPRYGTRAHDEWERKLVEHARKYKSVAPVDGWVEVTSNGRISYEHPDYDNLTHALLDELGVPRYTHRSKSIVTFEEAFGKG